MSESERQRQRTERENTGGIFLIKILRGFFEKKYLYILDQFLENGGNLESSPTIETHCIELIWELLHYGYIWSQLNALRSSVSVFAQYTTQYWHFNVPLFPVKMVR